MMWIAAAQSWENQSWINGFGLVDYGVGSRSCLEIRKKCAIKEINDALLGRFRLSRDCMKNVVLWYTTTKLQSNYTKTTTNLQKDCKWNVTFLCHFQTTVVFSCSIIHMITGDTPFISSTKMAERWQPMKNERSKLKKFVPSRTKKILPSIILKE